MTANRGKLLLGLKPIARHAFKDEKKWRSLYNDEMRGRRVAGYHGKLIPLSDVIVLEFEGRLETEIRSVVTERFLREAASNARSPRRWMRLSASAPPPL